jgi:predicted RNA-binding Zn-ribbon protein involved in translation (DUF1610 family)
MDRCPRQDPNYLKTGDVFEIACSGCGESIEFFKDEDQLKCPKCGKIVKPQADSSMDQDRSTE